MVLFYYQLFTWINCHKLLLFFFFYLKCIHNCQVVTFRILCQFLSSCICDLFFPLKKYRWRQLKHLWQFITEHSNKKLIKINLSNNYCVYIKMPGLSFVSFLPMEWQRDPWSWDWQQWWGLGLSNRTELQTESFSQCVAQLVILLNGLQEVSILPVYPKHSVT